METLLVNSSDLTKIMNVEIFYEEKQSLDEDEERCEENVEVEQNLKCQLSVHDSQCQLWLTECCLLSEICQIGLAQSAAFPCLQLSLILDFDFISGHS